MEECHLLKFKVSIGAVFLLFTGMETLLPRQKGPPFIYSLLVC